MSYLEWAEAQVAELELLTSMFPSQEELELTDQLALAELRSYMESPTDCAPASSRPQFLIKQKFDSAGTEGVTLKCIYHHHHQSRNDSFSNYFCFYWSWSTTDGDHFVVRLSIRVSQCVARYYSAVSPHLVTFIGKLSAAQGLNASKRSLLSKIL